MEIFLFIILILLNFYMFSKISGLSEKLENYEVYIKRIKKLENDIRNMKAKVDILYSSKNEKIQVQENLNISEGIDHIKESVDHKNNIENMNLYKDNKKSENKITEEQIEAKNQNSNTDLNKSEISKIKSNSVSNLSEKFSLNINSISKEKSINTEINNDKNNTEKGWECYKCGRFNKKENKFCVKCGKKHEVLNKIITHNSVKTKKSEYKIKDNISKDYYKSDVYKESKPQYTIENKIINMLKENFTGFIGSISLIIGIIFLSLYTAVYVGPAIRFLMLVGVSIGVFIISNILSKKEYWKELSKILRSTSAALYLFSTIAAVFIDGVKFIDNLNSGLMLILTGIALNIFVGKISSNQIFNGLHFFLNIIAMYIVMNNMDTYISNSIFILITGIICFISLYKDSDKDLNLDTVFILGVYFIFHMIWYLRNDIHTLTNIEKISGLLSIMVNGGFVLLSPYIANNNRSIENSTKNIIIYITSIIFSVGSFIPYFKNYNSSWKLMLGASVIFYLLSKVAKSYQCDEWLYNINVFVSQLFLVFAAIIRSFDLSVMNVNIIYSSLFLQCMYFAYIFINSNKRTLSLLGVILTYIFTFLILYRNIWGNTDINRIFIIITVITLCLFENFIRIKGIHLYNFLFDDKVDNPIHIFLPVIFLPILALFFRNTQIDLISGTVIICSFWVIEYLFKNKFTYRLNNILLFIIGIFNIINSGILELKFNDSMKTEFLLYLLTSIIPIIFFFKKERYFKFFKENIFFVYLSLFYLSFIYTRHISVFSPGIIWLILSVVLINVSKIFKNHSSNTYDFSQLFSIFYLLGFLIRHFYVDINTSYYFFNINFNLLSEFLFLVVISYIYWFIKNYGNQEFVLFKYKERVSEIIILWITFIIAYNINGSIQPMFWIGLAFILYFTGNKFSRQNLVAYSLVYYLVSVVQNSILTNMYVSTSNSLIENISVKGVVSLTFHILFAVITYRTKCYNKLKFDERSLIYNFNRLFREQIKYYLFLPLFIFSAMFLYTSFDKTILSLLWMIEIMILYIISISFGDKYLRNLSMSGLILIIARMIFYDLSQSSVLIRAFVFIGMGIILLVMNTIYSKYKERFDD